MTPSPKEAAQIAEDPGRLIWREHHEIHDARRNKMREAMEQYDRDVFHPAIRDLQQRCAVIGHKRGKFHDNGFGGTWFWCNQCGAKMESES